MNSTVGSSVLSEFRRTVNANSDFSLDSSPFSVFYTWIERSRREEDDGIGFSSNIGL